MSIYYQIKYKRKMYNRMFHMKHSVIQTLSTAAGIKMNHYKPKHTFMQFCRSKPMIFHKFKVKTARFQTK